MGKHVSRQRMQERQELAEVVVRVQVGERVSKTRVLVWQKLKLC